MLKMIPQKMISWINEHRTPAILVFIFVVVGFIILLTIAGIIPHLESIVLILMIVEIILLLVVIVIHVCSMSSGTEEETPGYDVLDVMNLSESMRRTAMALAMFREATPERIAKETKKPVSTEKANLESLVRMGYAFKAEGRKYSMGD